MNYKYIKFITLALAFEMSSLLYAASVQELWNNAQAQTNNKKHAEAIPLWEKVINAPDCSVPNKVRAIQNIARTYAWSLNNFDKAVEILLSHARKPGFDNVSIATMKNDAVNYLMRMNPQQKEKAIQLLEECLPLKDLNNESIIAVTTNLADLIHDTDKARADKLIQQALNVCENLNQRNRVRNFAAGIKTKQKLPAEAAVFYNMIVEDPENNASTKHNALTNIAKGYMPDAVKANQILQKILDSADANTETKAKTKVQMAENLQKQPNPDSKELYRIYSSVAKDQTLTNSGLRLLAFENAVRQAIQQKMSSETILADYEQMKTVPLNESEKIRFVTGYGNYLIQCKNFDKAAEIYQNYAREENNEKAQKLQNQWIGKMELSRGNLEKAFQLYSPSWQDLRSIAQQQSNSGKHTEAIPLWQKVIEAPDCSAPNKVAAIQKIAWTYAWPLSSFDKAVEILLKYVKDPALDNNAIVSLSNDAANYMRRMNPQPREQIIKLYEECLPLKDLNNESIIAVTTNLADLIHDTDKARADKLIQQALDACVNLNQRNRVRNHAGEIKTKQKLPAEAAVFYNMIVEDPENNTSAKHNALSAIAKSYLPDAVKANEALQQIIERDDANDETKARIRIQMAENLLKMKKPDHKQIFRILSDVALDKTLTNNGLRLQAFDQSIKQAGALQMHSAEILMHYEKMYAIPLKGGEQIRFITNYGNYLIQYNNYDKAEEIYKKYAVENNTPAAQKQQNEWLGKLDAAKGNLDKSIQYLLSAENYMEIATVYFNQKLFDEGNQKVLEGIAKQPQNKQRLFSHMIYHNPVEKVREMLYDPEIRKILKENPELYNALGGNKLNQAMEYAAYDYVSMVVPEYLKTIKNDKLPAQVLYFQINAEAMLNNKEKAMELIKQAAANEKVQDVTHQFRFRIMEAALIEDQAEALKKISAIIETYKTQFKDIKQLPEEMNRAGMTMVMLNDREKAELIVKARESLYSSMPKKSADVQFYKKELPVSVEGWMNILPELRKTIVPQKLERQLWGANVEFMLATDMAIKRDVAGGKDASGISTEFFPVCDQNALYIFIMAYDNNVPNIAEGFANGGSYELYLAPGERQPYYCSMINISQDNPTANGFYSNYRSEYSRAPRVGKDLKSETRVVAPNATATLLIYPWDMFYNCLPDSPGSSWQFDIMRWSGPGSSWSGSNSVHNRSTYGDLVFNLTAEQLTAIRRSILYKSRIAYNAHKGNAWRGTGIYDFWKNPQLGDVTFYNDVLLPYREKLEAVVAKITLDMDDETVNSIFLDYVDKLFNLDFDIAEMRNEYLENLMFSNAAK